LLGAGRDMAAFGPIESLADTLDWHYTDLSRVGDDLRVMARARPRDALTR
jgi:diaminohydroxyphosphoribosylaminopyrimidine deaminase/5-amino-6-(5-phosphoribosylamino)uracil reductase